MHETTFQHPPASLGLTRLGIWIGFLGGAVAWTVHFLLAYFIGEFGCVSPLKDWHFLGLTAVAWLVLLVTFASVIAATVATILAWRLRRRLAGIPEGGVEHYLGQTGVYMNGLFLFFIVAQAIPIFFFLRDC